MKKAKKAKRDSFNFYRSFFESISRLDFESQGKLYNAILNYAFNEQKEPENLNEIEKTIWFLLEPNLKKNYKNYLNSRKAFESLGNSVEAKSKRRSSQTEAKCDRRASYSTSTSSSNININIKNSKNRAKNKEMKEEAIRILECLNNIAGREYRPVDSNLNKIIALLKTKLTYDDFETVIFFKYNEWFEDEKMNQYLRPATLFAKSNFENYLAPAWEWRKKQEGDK
jgi:uncharacterized phage protein (TIGR02220 family)